MPPATLGTLPGYTYDPIRGRYFPTPPGPRATPAPIRSSKPRPAPPLRTERDAPDASTSTGFSPSSSFVGESISMKRRRVGVAPARGYRRREMGGYGLQDRGSLSNAEHLAGLEFEGISGTCVCHSDHISSLQNFTGGTFVAATAGGKVIMQDHEGTTHQLGICCDPLVGLHFDVARMTIMAIAASDSPHVHIFQRGNDNFDNLDVSTFDLSSLEKTEIYSVASYDEICVLASPRTLTTILNYDNPHTNTRILPFDPLAIEFGNNPNTLYIGGRNGSVLLADMRTPEVLPTAICNVPGGKAVVGVKKLDDGAVPFGIVASAMGSELLIYDTRFGKSPLHTLPDHINTYHANLDLALTPDSRFVFASGSDRRIGLWSTITGERVHPSPEGLGGGKESGNPLRRTFNKLVQKLSVRDDYGLDVACGGEVIHFGKPGGGKWAAGQEETRSNGSEEQDNSEGESSEGESSCSDL